MSLKIRRAIPGDESLILELLYELAEYEKLTDRFELNESIVARDFVGARQKVQCELAFDGDAPAGLAIWYWTYTSFAAGTGLFLEDLYVRQSERGRGFGLALLAHLARQAVDAGALRMDWTVLNWNKPSIAFYESLGACAIDEWTVYRLSGEALDAVSRRAVA
jgi:GNAT superfamily N-acetyltransferase